MSDLLTTQTLTTNATGTPSFKFSDIINVGSLFGSSDRGSKSASAINTVLDSGYAGTMAYLSADKTGSNALQKKAKTADGIYDGVNAAVSMIPGIGNIVGLGMTAFQTGMKHLAPKLKTIDVNKSIGASSAYGGLASSIGNQSADINAYNAAGIGKFTMGKNNIKSKTNDLRAQQIAGAEVLKNNTKQLAAAGNNTNYLNFRNNINFAGGIPSVPIGKNGINTEFILKRRTLKMQNGGPINVIVDGKLHSQLNHMKDVVPIPITTKGVPVTVLPKEGEGGPIEQAAELERDEIILHLQLTKRLEELAKENTDESMVEAGKILAKEILKNTKDSKSKLLKTVA